MKSLSLILPLVNVLILSGCAPTTHIQSSELQTDAQSLNKKAIVLTKLYAPDTFPLAINKKRLVKNTWERVDGSNPENRIRYDFSKEGFFSGCGSASSYPQKLVMV